MCTSPSLAYYFMQVYFNSTGVLPEPVPHGQVVPRPQNTLLRCRAFFILRHDEGRQLGLPFPGLFLKGNTITYAPTITAIFEAKSPRHRVHTTHHVNHSMLDLYKWPEFSRKDHTIVKGKGEWECIESCT